MKIELIDVTKKFKDNIVLDNISIEFKKGNIYGLYGKNGSGKSVLFKIISGLYVPTSGKVLIDNIDVTSKKIYSKNIGALIERPSFFSDLTGFKNLQFLADINKRISKDEICRFLDLANLTDVKNKKYKEYSLGMKQKLGIIQAIMEDPDVIILDEPFNGVDEDSLNNISNYLLKIKKEKIIIISSHVKENLINLCDTIYSLKNGNLYETDFKK